MKKQKLFFPQLLLICLFLSSSYLLSAQTTLVADGSIYARTYNGTYNDYIFENCGDGTITFTLVGGDGGGAQSTNNCVANGGDGATVVVAFKVGDGVEADELSVDGSLRLIPGGGGESNISNTGGSQGNGGSGTAILYTEHPNPASISTSVATTDFSQAATEWVILAVAGGGGGAYRSSLLSGCIDRYDGQGGRSSTSGGDGGGSDGGDGGTNGNGGTYGENNAGGGGAFTNGSDEGTTCGDAPLGGIEGDFSSIDCASAQYYGFGSGGTAFNGGISGTAGGGGGGGYSGGGGGDVARAGGGGGSFVNAVATSNTITAGGDSEFLADNGYINYQYTDLGDNIAPSFTCTDATIILESGEIINFTNANDFTGTIEDCNSSSFSSSVTPSQFDWLDIGDHIVAISVADQSGNATSCNATLTIIEKLVGEISGDATDICESETVALSANYTGGLEPVTYAWSNSLGSNAMVTATPSTSTTYFVTITDDYGQSEVLSHAVNVQDNTPNPICQNINAEISSTSLSVTINADDVFAGVLDGCQNVSYTLDRTTFDCDDAGAQTVTLTMTNIVGETASCTATVNVIDAACTGSTVFTYTTGGGDPFDGITTESNMDPEFGDLDCDGDFDFLVGLNNGTILYYQNTGTAETPSFTQQTGASNPMNGVDIGTDASTALADLDADGDLDLVLISNTNPYYYENTGSTLAPIFTARTGVDNILDGLSISGGRPHLADVDKDGDFDLLYGTFSGFIGFRENIGDANNPVFSVSSSPFGSIDVGTQADPIMLDFDGDGDLDLFIGDSGGRVQYYLNTGDAMTPTFSAITTVGNPLISANVLGNAHPTIQDIDNDGDLDALLGSNGAGLNYYDGAGAPAVGEYYETIGIPNPMDAYDAGINSTPTFVDIDTDGDLDIVSGLSDGTFKFYENIAGELIEQTGASSPLDGLDVGTYSSPAFADLDGDGDLDMLSGKTDGLFVYFPNGGTATNPSYSQAANADNPMNGEDVGLRSQPHFVDIDANGTLDLIVGTSDGEIWTYFNDGTCTTPDFRNAGGGNPLSGINVGGRAAPFAIDEDQDGDFDIYSGASNGTIYYIENVGSAENPAFSLASGSANPLNGEDLGTYTRPAFADLDCDGGYEAIIGSSDGKFYYYQNEYEQSVNDVVVEVKVFLQGPHNTVDMDTNLDAAALLPLTDPYGLSETAASIPADVVDWVTIEIRDPDDNTIVVAERACFLRNDGQVLDLDGTVGALFSNLSVKTGYVVVKHRNHLGVMTGSVVTF